MCESDGAGESAGGGGEVVDDEWHCCEVFVQICGGCWQGLKGVD